jgi:hypothetical protein
MTTRPEPLRCQVIFSIWDGPNPDQRSAILCRKRLGHRGKCKPSKQPVSLMTYAQPEPSRAAEGTP